MKKELTPEQLAEKKRKKFVGRSIGICFLVFLGLFVFFGLIWVMDNWAVMTMPELIYHAQHAGTNISGASPALVLDFVLLTLLPTLLGLAIAISICIVFKKMNVTRRLTIAIATLFSLTLGTIKVVQICDWLDLPEYIQAVSTSSNWINNNYIDPTDVNVTFGSNKHNLVTIYCESTEVSFSDVEHGGFYQTDVIPELTQLGLEGECFSNSSTMLNGAYALQGSNFTSGSLLSQIAGFPLLPPSFRFNNEVEGGSDLYAGLRTIGDILHDNGYRSAFMIGSEATFGDRDKLMSQGHGWNELYDLKSALKDGWVQQSHVSDVNWWGFEDDLLFQFAKEKFMTQAGADYIANGTPFHCALLTVDTHFPNGWVPSNVKIKDPNEQYDYVYAQSAKRIKDMVDWIKAQPWGDDTTIVLVGDHPTMDADYLPSHKVSTHAFYRKSYVSYINSVANNANDFYREYTVLDHFPTVLASIGAEIEGNKLGLGTNLFSTEKTFMESWMDDVRVRFADKIATLSTPEEIEKFVREKTIYEVNIELTRKSVFANYMFDGLTPAAARVKVPQTNQ